MRELRLARRSPAAPPTAGGADAAAAAAGGSMAMASAATPARSSAARPRASASSAARARRIGRRPEQQQRRLAGERRQRSRLVRRRRAPRTPAPGTARRARSRPAASTGGRRRRRRPPAPRWPGRTAPPRARRPRRGARRRVQRHVGEHLHCARRPRRPSASDARARRRGRRAAPSSAATGSPEPACDDPASCVSRSVSTHDARADRVAVARPAPVRRSASDAPRGAKSLRNMPQLRRLPRRHHGEVRIAVAIDVEHGERPAVLIEVEADRARHVVEAARAVVAQEHVALPAGDRVVDQQLVDRPPRVVVRRALDAASAATAPRPGARRSPRGRRVAVARQHAVGDVEVVPAVAVEVERVGRPGPAAHLGARLRASCPRSGRRRGCGRASCRARAGDRARGRRPARRA